VQRFENRRKLKNPRFWKKCKDLRKAQGSEESVKFWEKGKILRKRKILRSGKFWKSTRLRDSTHF